MFEWKMFWRVLSQPFLENVNHRKNQYDEMLNYKLPRQCRFWCKAVNLTVSGSSLMFHIKPNY